MTWGLPWVTVFDVKGPIHCTPGKLATLRSITSDTVRIVRDWLSSRSITFDFNFKLWKVLAILSFEQNLIQSPANAGSWLGTKNALYYCAHSANSISWVLFVSSYTTAIDSITACLAHAPKKCTQSGIFQFDIKATFQNTGSLCTRA